MYVRCTHHWRISAHHWFLLCPKWYDFLIVCIRQQLDIPRLTFCTYQYCVWPLEGDVSGVQLSGNHWSRQPGCYLLVAGLHRAQKAQTCSVAAAGAAVHPARWERCERWDAQGLAEHQLPVMVDLHHLCAGVWEARGREKTRPMTVSTREGDQKLRLGKCYDTKVPVRLQNTKRQKSRKMMIDVLKPQMLQMDREGERARQVGREESSTERENIMQRKVRRRGII